MLWMCCKRGWGRVSTCVVIEWGARAAGVVLVPGILLLAEDSFTLVARTAGCRWGWGMGRLGYRENTPFLEGGGRDALPSDPA